MKYELGSFVRFFAQYFQNLFNEESFCGKFYDKICVCYCDAALKRSFYFSLYERVDVKSSKFMRGPTGPTAVSVGVEFVKRRCAKSVNLLGVMRLRRSIVSDIGIGRP